MILTLHYFLLTAYAATPIFYAAVLTHRWHRHRSRAAIKALGGTATTALLLGGAVTIFFAVAVGARPRYDQALLAWLYFMTVLIALKGMMILARRLADAACRSRRLRRACDRRPVTKTLVRVASYVLLVGAIGLPYVMAAVMTYRPKVAVVGDPLADYGWPFEPVHFKAADGTPISGWWIPAAINPAHPNHASRTVLLCHGLGAHKLNQLHMARLLHPLGYNVLTFDFRAHGQSGGQFTSFGDIERRDVLAAVGWLKANHPHEARQIIGVGASLGAAALIAAASQKNSPLSSEIDALVLYGTYADLGQLGRDVSARFLPPLNVLAGRIAVPFASLHAGTNLQAFAPAALIGTIARPILIIHGRSDEIIPVRHAQALFDAAREPKKLILLDSDHNGIIEDDRTARAVVEFLNGTLPH